MKLTICDRCGKVIENYKENINKSTITVCNYDLCASCSRDMMLDMKFPNTKNEKEFIEEVSRFGMCVKKIKEVENGNK